MHTETDERADRTAGGTADSATGAPAGLPASKVVVVVRPGRRTGTVMAWLRQLLPAAVLLVSPVSVPPAAPEEASLVVEADEVDSPMALADALARARDAASWRR